MPTPPLRRPSLADQIYSQLKADLNDFRLVPGDRFTEGEIAERLGVSRTPVREALFRLRNEGLLDVAPKNGWFVRPIDFALLDQLYDLRLILEQASIARLCAMPELPQELDGLKAVWQVPATERLTDVAGVGALDEAFHATLVQAAGNAEAARVHWDVTERIRVIRRLDFTRPARIDATYVEHAKILRAVLQRNAEQALLLLRSHVTQSKAEVRKITLATIDEAKRRAAA